MNTRRMNDIYRAIDDMRAHTIKEVDKAVKTCLNCNWFNEEKEECLKYTARPPARVIAYGCKDHTDDVPF